MDAAPNEIYTAEVKIDRRGIEVSNADSAQRTVINNTEFSGYYNEEKIFSLNKDETITKKTTVDGELTVGKTKFVPMPQRPRAEHRDSGLRRWSNGAQRHVSELSRFQLRPLL